MCKNYKEWNCPEYKATRYLANLPTAILQNTSSTNPFIYYSLIRHFVQACAIFHSFIYAVYLFLFHSSTVSAETH